MTQTFFRLSLGSQPSPCVLPRCLHLQLLGIYSLLDLDKHQLAIILAFIALPSFQAQNPTPHKHLADLPRQDADVGCASCPRTLLCRCMTNILDLLGSLKDPSKKYKPFKVSFWPVRSQVLPSN